MGNTCVGKARMYKNIIFCFVLCILPAILVFFLFSQTSCTQTLSDSIDYISPYVVQINIIATELGDGRPFLEIPVGSGFILNKDGYVITANHNIESGRQYLQQIQA